MTFPRHSGLLLVPVSVCTAAAALSLCAQTPTAAPVAATANTITIRMYDARSGHQITPSNFVVRFDHNEDIHNETLHIDDDGTGRITVPAGAMFLAIEGTYDSSTEIYFNCDTGMEKDDRRRHWYSIADILATGVIAPNECYKGKYERPRLPVKPGEFSFYVRQHNWRDMSSY